mmetsp:Transcript_32884/g.74872  ORF Transcript_32884/g.74872 Transcript_32884/m.74872 type:complete len:194 (-) Transcript_32884:33-614(-)
MQPSDAPRSTSWLVYIAMLGRVFGLSALIQSEMSPHHRGWVCPEKPEHAPRGTYHHDALIWPPQPCMPRAMNCLLGATSAALVVAALRGRHEAYCIVSMTDISSTSLLILAYFGGTTSERLEATLVPLVSILLDAFSYTSMRWRKQARLVSIVRDVLSAVAVGCLLRVLICGVFGVTPYLRGRQFPPSFRTDL